MKTTLSACLLFFACIGFVNSFPVQSQVISAPNAWSETLWRKSLTKASQSDHLFKARRSDAFEPVALNSTVLSIYYLNYNTETFMGMRPEWLKTKSYKVVVSRPEDRTWLLKTLETQGDPAVYDPLQTRLVLEVPGTNQRLMVNQEGIVRNGSKQYRLSGIQWESLHLFLRLTFRLN